MIIEKIFEGIRVFGRTDESGLSICHILENMVKVFVISIKKMNAKTALK